VAIFFCCNNNEHEDGAIFILETIALNSFSFNKLLEIQVISDGVADFYHKLIYELGELFDADAKINGIRIGDIKSNPVIQIKFTHITESKKNKFLSVEIKTELPKAIDIEGNLVSHLYSDITTAFSNIVPFRAPYLNSRIRTQHGVFTFHGGVYFDGKEFIKLQKMETHPYLKEKLVKIKIKASDKGNFIKELSLAGIRKATLYPEMEYQAEEIKCKFRQKK